jgi:hypothetical protein
MTTQSIIYSHSFKCWERVQYGEGMVWSVGLHKAFPAEFRAIARELVLLFRTPHNPLGRAMPRDVIFVITKKLAVSYCKSSPLDRWTYPDVQPEGDAGDD